jgi:hypothetical protein
MRIYCSFGGNDALPIILTFAIRNPTLRKIVRRQLYGNAITGDNSDKMFPHLTGDVSYNFMAVFELYPKLGSRQSFDDGTRQLDYFLIGCHKYNLPIIAVPTVACKVFYAL